MNTISMKERKFVFGLDLVLVAPALLLVIAFIVVPYINVVGISFSTHSRGETEFTLNSYTRILTDGFYLEALGRTLLIGLIVSTLCLIIGYPLAYHLARTRTKWSGLLYAAVLSPLLIGVVVRTFAWVIVLSSNGVANQALNIFGIPMGSVQLMNNEFGVILAMTHVLLPIMILSLVGILQTVDPSVEAAARSLGASRLQMFRRVTFPLSLPGVISGTILVFILAVSAYVTPLVVGGSRVKTFPILIVQTLLDTFQWELGSALALVLAMSGLIIVIIFSRLTSAAVARLP
ncbi:ABC transporter permease [Pseudochelatococcus sp. B33]